VTLATAAQLLRIGTGTANGAKPFFRSPLGRLGLPSPTMLAALAPLALGRAIERNRVTRRRRLLSLRP